MKKQLIITLFIIVITVLLSLLVPQISYAAESDYFDENIVWTWEYNGSSSTMNYGLLVPSTANSQEKIPMIVYLHGYSGSVLTQDEVRNWSLPGAIQTWGLNNFNAYVLCPHADEADVRWDNSKYMNNIKQLIDEMISKYNVDEDCIIITGESRGGTGALALAQKMPDYFAKCVAFSPFYTGPFNTSIPTIVYFGNSSDAARGYVNNCVSAFGQENVFIYEVDHGDVAYESMQEDSGNDVRNRPEIIVQI